MCLMFLIVFPIAIIAIWNAPREDAPLVFIVPFTAVFAIAMPFLVRQIAGAHTRRIAIDRPSCSIKLSMKRPFRAAQSRTIAMGQVRRVLFETTDHDGYWYCAMLDLRDGDRIGFAQGNHEETVFAKAERMLMALRMMQPDMEIVEVHG